MRYNINANSINNMELNTTECGTRQALISREECDDFEIVIGEESGLLLQSDGKNLKVFRHSPLTPEDPYDLQFLVPLQRPKR